MVYTLLPAVLFSKDVRMMKIKVKRPFSFWDTWLPLTVKLDDDEAGAVRNGHDTVIPMTEERAELSVSYMHDRSDRVPVEAGDVITVKKNKASYFITAAVIIAILIPLVPFILGMEIVPYVWAMLVAMVIILAISQMMKSYEIEQTGQLTEEELTEEGIDGVHVRRTNGIFESALPLSVKLNEEEKEQLKSGEQTAIPMKDDNAEMSVEFLYEAGNRVKVETGDVVSIKRNWIFYLRLTILAIAIIGIGLLTVLGVNLNFEPVFYGIAIVVMIVILGAMSLMKTVKVEVVDKAH